MTRDRRWLAHGMAALTSFLLAASVVAIYVADPDVGSDSRAGLVLEFLMSGVLAFVVGFGVVGWLLASRLPHHPIGWCFSFGALMWSAGALTQGWFELAVSGHVELGVAARICATVSVFSWIFSMPFSVQLPLLLLPDGQPLSRSWRPVVWIVLAGVVVGTAGFLTRPGSIEGTDPALHLTNPLGLSGLGPLPLVLALTGAGMLLVGTAAGFVAVVLRFRRSRGTERQQMRWVALGGVGPALSAVTGVAGGLVPLVISGVVGTLGILALPVCVGVAVLRYRLYDLGRVVSRTLSYAVLTALLVGVYLVLVAASTRLLPDGSSLAVAGSTLAAAALFQPLRRRVQSVVDHRFNRARYDADRTVAAFSQRLRAEVDLAVVRTDLLEVVHETLQPASVELWLRHPDRAVP